LGGRREEGVGDDGLGREKTALLVMKNGGKSYRRREGEEQFLKQGEGAGAREKQICQANVKGMKADQPAKPRKRR